MNIEKRLIQISKLLKNHEKLIQTEALDLYPFDDHIQSQYGEMLCAITSLDRYEKIELELNFHKSSKLANSHIKMINEINQLKELPRYKTKEYILPNELKRKLSQKKQHEIFQIKNLMDEKTPKHLIDIGSGAGHLSSVLIFENDLTSLCIDANEDYQKIGKSKLQKYFPDIYKRLTFKTVEIDKNNLEKHIQKKGFLIGLHACGNLSTDLIQNYNSNSFEGLLSLGCCYHKLTNEGLNLSQSAKRINLQLSNHALTMAAKTFKSPSKNDLDKKEKVKKFRYIAHFLMLDILKLPFRSFGNGSKSDYQLDFSTYVKKFIPEAKHLSDEYLESFFNEYLPTYHKVIDLGIIRSHFARLIEIYLILDRALYLKEQNLEVQIIQLFDEHISPRNLAIYIPPIR